MKRLLSILLLLLLTVCPSLAEVDNAMLENAPGMQVFVAPNGVDLIIRPEGQPYMGHTDQDDVAVCAYLDLAELPDEHATVVRLTICLESEELINANELRITEDGKTYAFDLANGRSVSEYDLMYYEDYALCLTDQSLPLLKAIARAKSDAHTFIITGDRTVTLTIDLSGDDAARLYDLYVNAGGDKQSLELLRDLWPVSVSK